MKLDEAIELQNVVKEGFPISDTEKYYKALELTNEAAKRIHNARIDGTFASTNPLPGETEE